jgi:GTPase
MNTSEKIQRFLLISIIPRNVSDEDAFKQLKELKSLVNTYGGVVVDYVIQRREVHDKGSYIGSGKLQEAADLITKEKIDAVVLNAIVKPGQIFDMQKILQKSNKIIKVWDRVDLIIEIFDKHAKTAEAKLQIELAAMRHMGPRIYGMGYVLSRQTGGIGGRGIGETNTELMKRHWREQIKKIQDKLDKLAHDRERQLARRRKVGFQTISIIGYTNAGKTSLFNILTGKKKLAQNVLFATLDSSVGKVYLPNAKYEVLVSDTIGFIQNLPAKLIDAFKSTLMESMHSDLLLHVIDASDDEMERKISLVENILKELPVATTKRLYIFNKIDATAEVNRSEINNKYREYNPLFISVKDEIGIDDLILQIENSLSANVNDQVNLQTLDSI